MAVQKTIPRQGDLTVEDFLRLVEDGQKADLIDGVIYVASPDKLVNNDLNDFIQFVLGGYVDVRRLGRLTANRYAYFLTPRRAPEPDVAFVASAHSEILQQRGGDGGPDVAVEIVSDDSRTRDYREKKELYRAAGVAEYWILDPDRLRAEFHRLANGEYVPISLDESGIFRSAAVPGFWLKLDWLFADPLPSKYACLQELLRGDPGSIGP